ncbi:MAG: LLM class F420-dependent oxidoreductase [Chloroflexota bacterium]
MKLGLTSMNIGDLCQPELAGRMARLAEELGYDSLWTAEHVVMADPSPRMSPTTRLLDPLMALVFFAACTSTIELGTGIVILPQRQPVVLAKELTSLDVLSGGRFMFGIGVGWQEAEMNATGVQMAERGARADEYLDALRALWAMDKPEYHGKYVSFAGVNAYPRPVQRPGPRLVMGGYAPATYRRTVERAHGWFGFNRSLEQTRETLATLHELRAAVQRPAELGEIDITVSPPPPVDRTMVQAYAELGVHRLLLRPPDGDARAIEAFVRDNAPAALGATPAR